MAESDAEFERRKKVDVAGMRADAEFQELGRRWFDASVRHRYSYNFRWMGLPIIQYPADIVAMQELCWRVRPDLIVETGVARGGSLVFYASMLEMIGGDGLVAGVELALAPENRAAIEGHPLARRIRLIDGSSIAEETVAQVRGLAQGRSTVMVVLDSNHTHDHVLAELRAYAPLVRQGSYIVVFDTVVERLPPAAIGARPWGPGDSPHSAAQAFLRECPRFEVDRGIDDRLLLSVCPEGFLRCVKD